MSTKRSVPVQRAITLYGRLKSWARVSRALRRSNGMPYTASGIFNAVRRHDLGRAA